MTSALEINGKKLHPIKDVVKEVSYSRDYITRLAREKKIVASHVGRQWFVDLESLKDYESLVLFEQEVRNKQLSEDRKQESILRDSIDKQNQSRDDRVKTVKSKSLAQAAMVLFFGLFGGLLLNQFVNFSQPSSSVQVARTVDSTTVSTHPDFVVKESAGIVVETNLETVFSNVESGEVLVPYFSKEVSELSVADNGILLLPNKRVDDFAAEEVFSDEVIIRTLDNGKQVAVKTDVDGNQVGEEIPLVIIPVKTEEKNL